MSVKIISLYDKFTAMQGFSIRYKVTIGYVLLTLLLIATMWYVYRGVQHITEIDEYDRLISDRRRITNEIIGQLNRAEIIGQTIAIGQVTEYASYKDAISLANAYIDSLRCITDDAVQIARIDSVSALVAQKEMNMRSLMEILKEDATDDLYRREIEAMIQLQDSLLDARRTNDKVFVRTVSRKVANKRKGFFGRVRDVFSPSKNDSIVVNDTIYEVMPYHVHENMLVDDTITDILREMQMRASDIQEERLVRLDRQMRSLSLSSMQLSGKLQQLLKTIEDEDSQRVWRQQAENELVRRRTAMTISCIAIASLLLAWVFLFFIWRDIARSNHYRKELEKAKQRAEELLKAKEQLMLTITHDIKAPVGAILGYIELLENITTGEREHFYLNNMQGSANHLLGLVTSLLDFHKLDADKMECQSVPFHAKELFEGIVANFIPQARSKGLELTAEISGWLDNVFIGDPLRIRQIAENLMGNAIKFTDEGSVRLCAEWVGGNLRLGVSDTGCGITPEEQEVIYKEFTRLSNAQGKEGFGLGLAITSKLVQLLGGKIRIESRVGEGTTFHIEVPLERSGADVPADAGKACDVPDVRPLELLLIDDDRLQLEMTAALLAGTPVSVVCCTHPDELFIHARQKRFDVIVTDIQMPAMSGIELISRLREVPELSALPVVAMTARSDMDSQLLAGHGFAACLHKPFTRKELLAVLADVTKGGNFDFGQMTSFAGDDKEGIACIMETFVSETRKKRDILERAMSDKDMSAVTVVTHQLLPVFVMLDARQGKEELEWFEARRDSVDYPPEAVEKIKLILGVVDNMIAEAECAL